MKILVLVGKYPDPGGYLAQHFIHVRNVAYQNSGMDVTVLCFSASEEYVYQGIRVITPASYVARCKDEQYDAVILHQPNLRYHYRFMRKYAGRFPHYIWFFHGQEVQRVEKVYPEPYPYMRKPRLVRWMRDQYDKVKLMIWRRYLIDAEPKSNYVFVSRYIYDAFFKWTKIPAALLKDKCQIIYNGIGKDFEKGKYDDAAKKRYDFITIRHTLDWSHCCMDIINDLAKANPTLRFLVIGKGKFFSQYEKAANITWEDATLPHAEIINRLQSARCALMLTRQDTQGLMMCEMASIGMPVITSDIPVCHEVFDGFSNVAMIKNDDSSIDLEKICRRLEQGEPYAKNEKYYSKNTSLKEIELIKSILAGNPCK